MVGVDYSAHSDECFDHGCEMDGESDEESDSDESDNESAANESDVIRLIMRVMLMREYH